MVIVTLCLFGVVGLGLGMTVRWPLLAIIAALCLFGSVAGLGLTGDSWISAAGKATAVVVVLEVGFLIGSFAVDYGLRKEATPLSATSHPDPWAGEQVASRANAVFRSPLPGLPPDDHRL